MCMGLSYKLLSVLNIYFSTQRLGIYILGTSIAEFLLKYLHFYTWDSVLYSRICSEIYVPLYNYQDILNIEQ